eukprot:11199638-Lingulodinium_polyedra.AAC.1
MVLAKALKAEPYAIRRPAMDSEEVEIIVLDLQKSPISWYIEATRRVASADLPEEVRAKMA